jgi:hypothetical protein
VSLVAWCAPRSEAPSLCRRYSDSSVRWTSPTSRPATTPRAMSSVATARRAWSSHVAQRPVPPCRSQYPGGPCCVHMSVASGTDGGLPRHLGGSASATPLSRPAQDSLALRPGCLLISPRETFPAASAIRLPSSPCRLLLRRTDNYSGGSFIHWSSAPFVAHQVREGIKSQSRMRSSTNSESATASKPSTLCA